MVNEILIQIISLIYILTLSVVYFLKRKYYFLESRIYKLLLIFTSVTLTLDILSIYFVNNYQEQIIYPLVISKIYFISLLAWVLIFIAYVLLHKTNDKYKTFRELMKKSVLEKSWVIVSIILLIVMLPLKVNYDISPFLFYGNGVSLVYATVIFGSFFLLVLLAANIKGTTAYKAWALFISIMLLACSFAVQILVKEIDIISCGISLVTMFLYFTIENPDLKYIDELNELKKAAEDNAKEKTYFLASMSHEIRTPLNAIIGLSEGMMDEEIPHLVHEDIKNINRAGNNLLEIINNILDITKLEEGKISLNNRTYNLGDIIAEVTDITKVLLDDRPISFKVEALGDIPTLLMGDEVKVYQILVNLVSNACKYTNKGNVTLQIDSKLSSNKTKLIFKVIDTGIGIKKSNYDKIFQKFERLNQEQKTIQGTGLGLVITKTLVEMMGGTISFESEYQKGTTFTVELEQEVIDKSTINDMSVIKRKRNVVYEHFDGRNYSVLIVDDNNLNVKVAVKFLKLYNFQISTAKSGLECINLTKSNKYDLILLDHMMPEMDGIQTLYNLKQRASGFDTPVVVLTANSIDGAKESYLKEGFVDYLAKPINQVELDRVLREQLKIGSDK